MLVSSSDIANIQSGLCPLAFEDSYKSASSHYGIRYGDDDKRPSQYTASSVSVPHVSMMYSIHMHGYTFSIHYIDSTRLVYLRRSLPSSTSSLPSNTSSSTYALTPKLLWKVLLFRHHPFRVPPRLAHQEKIPRYCKTSELSDLRRKGHLPAYS